MNDKKKGAMQRKNMLIRSKKPTSFFTCWQIPD